MASLEWWPCAGCGARTTNEVGDEFVCEGCVSKGFVSRPQRIAERQPDGKYPHTWRTTEPCQRLVQDAPGTRRYRCNATQVAYLDRLRHGWKGVCVECEKERLMHKAPRGSRSMSVFSVAVAP